MAAAIYIAIAWTLLRIFQDEQAPVTGRKRIRKLERSADKALDGDLEARQQERRNSNAKATSSAHVPAPERHAAALTKQPKPLAQASPEDAAGEFQSESGNVPEAVDAAKAAGAAHSSPAVTQPSAKVLSAASTKAAGRLLPTKSSSLPAFALPGATSHATALSRTPSQAGSLLGGNASSTRIALPPSLTHLGSLRSKTCVPEGKDIASPVEVEAEVEAAAVAAAAAAEAQLKTVTQQFDALLHNTLQRTKESVHKVTQFAVKAAAGKNGKIAAHRLVIIVLDMIETAQMSKRVDLFYLLDSLLQVNQAFYHALMYNIPGVCIDDMRVRRPLMLVKVMLYTYSDAGLPPKDQLVAAACCQITGLCFMHTALHCQALA